MQDMSLKTNMCLFWFSLLSKASGLCIARSVDRAYSSEWRSILQEWHCVARFWVQHQIERRAEIEEAKRCKLGLEPMLAGAECRDRARKS
jgi:hypothetical protein